MSWLAPLTSPAEWTSPDGCSAASIFTTLLMTVVAKGMREARARADRTRDIVSVSIPVARTLQLSQIYSNS